MTFTTVCQILLGSLLVLVGMLGSAIADRIRGIVRGRMPSLPLAQTVASMPRDRVPRRGRQFETGDVIAPVVPVARAAPLTKPSAPVVTKMSPDEAMAIDVQSALVAAGYTKRIAETAVRACVGDERATVETWVKAALRRVNNRVSA